VALAHLLFNVPLAVWILEGFMSGMPREIDETAYIDGYSFPRFFVKIFLPLIARPASASRPSSASCSAGSSCCWRARSPA
jgi:ABC-type glycerol-3-phosphate transport system permease component